MEKTIETFNSKFECLQAIRRLNQLIDGCCLFWFSRIMLNLELTIKSGAEISRCDLYGFWGYRKIALLIGRQFGKKLYKPKDVKFEFEETLFGVAKYSVENHNVDFYKEIARIWNRLRIICVFLCKPNFLNFPSEKSNICTGVHVGDLHVLFYKLLSEILIICLNSLKANNIDGPYDRIYGNRAQSFDAPIVAANNILMKCHEYLNLDLGNFQSVSLSYDIQFIPFYCSLREYFIKGLDMNLWENIVDLLNKDKSYDLKPQKFELNNRVSHLCKYFFPEINSDLNVVDKSVISKSADESKQDGLDELDMEFEKAHAVEGQNSHKHIYIAIRDMLGQYDQLKNNVTRLAGGEFFCIIIYLAHQLQYLETPMMNYAEVKKYFSDYDIIKRVNYEKYFEKLYVDGAFIGKEDFRIYCQSQTYERPYDHYRKLLKEAINRNQHKNSK